MTVSKKTPALVSSLVFCIIVSLTVVGVIVSTNRRTLSLQQLLLQHEQHWSLVGVDSYRMTVRFRSNPTAKNMLNDSCRQELLVTQRTNVTTINNTCVHAPPMTVENLFLYARTYLPEHDILSMMNTQRSSFLRNGADVRVTRMVYGCGNTNEVNYRIDVGFDPTYGYPTVIYYSIVQKTWLDHLMIQIGREASCVDPPVTPAFLVESFTPLP